MKDEIKEILDKLKSLVYDDYCLEFSVDYIERKEEKILLDYITNLQTIEHQYSAILSENAELENKITNLQEENKRIFSKVNDDELLISNAMIYAETQDYKSRNEKANTLLDEMLERAYIDGEYIMYDYSTSELLEIKQTLEGEDYNKVERAYLDDEWIGEDKDE